MDYGSDEWINYSLGLEVERVDLTHTKKPLTEQQLNFQKFAQGKRELKAKAAQLESMREQRDKLFFNAGRYAGGARDDVATQANKVIDALLESEG
jgi:hypothetical protein